VEGVDGVAISGSAPSDVRAGGFTSGGFQDGVLYSSTNGAATWTLSPFTLPHQEFTAVAFDPITPTTIYVGTNGQGLRRQVAGGGFSASHAGLIGAHVPAAAASPLPNPGF